jgi:AcrR family transcriptional regulator
MADGLRLRKRRAAMRHIQEVALDLFDQRGFENVSIEEIARTAEVSPSSIYRYFGTKEQVVLYDEVDAGFIDQLEHGLAELPPIEAVRRAMTAVLTDYFARDDPLTRRKVRYAFEEPALRAATLEQTDVFVPILAEALARASKRPTTDLEIQVAATAIVAALIAAVRHWYTAGASCSLAEEIGHALDFLEAGLQLRTGEAVTPPSRRATSPRRRRTADDSP